MCATLSFVSSIAKRRSRFNDRGPGDEVRESQLESGICVCVSDEWSESWRVLSERGGAKATKYNSTSTVSFSLTPCSHAHRSTRARAALLSLSIAHISRSRPLSCSHSLVIGNCYTAPGHSPAARSPYHFIHSSSIACTMSLSPLLASRSFGGRDTRAVCRSAASHPVLVLVPAGRGGGVPAPL